MKLSKQLVWLSLTVGIMCSLSACGASDKKESKAAQKKEAQKEAASQIEKLDVSAEALKTVKKGGELEIKNLKEDTVYTLNIHRVQESVPGIMSISADIGGEDNAQASLIVRDGKLFGILNFYTKGALYEVGYDTTLNSQYMKKMGPENLDEKEGSKPLVPNQKPLGN
jgi:ribosomal protein L28